MATCTTCGTSVDGLKFCGSCGTKVQPPQCVSCSAVLMPGSKFCGECGTPVAKKEIVAPTEEKKESEVKAETPKKEITPPVEVAESPKVETVKEAPKIESPAVTNVVVEEAARPITPVKPDVGEPERPQSTQSTQSPVDRVKAEVEVSSEEKKKKFSVKSSPKCAVCDKSVYETERAVDSSGIIFHKDCFRCKTCRVHLNGRQRIQEPEVGSMKITIGQYLVAKEGSLLGAKGEFFCDKHTIKARGSVVKAQVIDEKARDDNELKRVASMRKEQNAEAKESMQMRVGDMLPTCARCGRPIDKGQKAMTSGIQRMHESCPTKEESEKALRTTRFFVKKAPERLAGTLTCDKETRHPHTFLYEMDKDTLAESLKKPANDRLVIRYLPDAQARAASHRKLIAPSSDATRQFDMNFKDFFEFTFKDAKNNDAIVNPSLNVAKQDLLIKKFHFSNGVLQTLDAYFKYDEATRLCTAEKIEITMEMWPPEAAAEMSNQLDPLASLKAERREASQSLHEVEVEPVEKNDVKPVEKKDVKHGAGHAGAADTKKASSEESKKAAPEDNTKAAPITEKEVPATQPAAQKDQTAASAEKPTKPKKAGGKCAIM